jgi:hypothetical protein
MANKKVAPLTDTEIKNAKPKEKDYTLADGNGLQEDGFILQDIMGSDHCPVGIRLKI